MTGARITIEVDEAPVVAVLARIAAAGRDAGPFMEAVGGHLLTATQRRFETTSGPGGRAWQRLAPRTARERVKKGYGTDNILRRFGMLYASLTYVATAAEVEVGTNLKYAAIHQFGGTIAHPAREAHFREAPVGAATLADGRRVGSRLRFAKATDRAESLHVRTIGPHAVTIPARPYLGIDATDETAIVEEGEAFLAGAIGGADAGGTR